MNETKKKRGINPIDVLVIIVVIAIVALGGYKLLNPNNGSAAPGTPITFTVRCSGVEPEVYNSLQEYLPDQLMASGELGDGHVVSVSAQPHTPSVLTTTNGQPVVVERDDLLDLTFTVEGEVKNLVTNELAKQEIRIGKSYTVKTLHIEIPNGIILTCHVGEAGA